MRRYRVYYRFSLTDYAVTRSKSLVVNALNKVHAIEVAQRTMNKRGRFCVPTGYVTLIGKPRMPF